MQIKTNFLSNFLQYLLLLIHATFGHLNIIAPTLAMDKKPSNLQPCLQELLKQLVILPL
jgi:hypothetical protein